jgi:hypothetical protein
MPAKNKLPENCIGMKADFKPKELKNKHIARGGYVFNTEEDYLNHISPITGHRPTEIEHQDALTNGRFSRASGKALERGAKK